MRQLALFKLDAREVRALAHGDMIELTLNNGAGIVLSGEREERRTQTAKGRKSVECPECGKRFSNTQKLGSHRYGSHQVVGTSSDSRTKKRRAKMKRRAAKETKREVAA